MIKLIGEEGMGAVYLAEQRHPINRKVALKIIKAGLDTKQVLARFEAERQALAMMDRPNIAKVLEAGSTDAGRPYSVMEFVEDIPATQHCDEHHLTTRERLRLVIAICSAVHHAHQKGIIHRDLKLSNILVTESDGMPIPKVIDFGIAKAATRGQLTDKTLVTEFHHFVGTPAYTNPEQVDMSGIDVDTRTDIYSLGVLLYELLTGTTPIEAGVLKKAAYAEIQRTILETIPPKPSTRLTERGRHAVAESAIPIPHSELKRELDWVVMKALEKDRSRRYDSAAFLAQNLERFLADEPVAAVPQSTLYRLRKFAQRHRAAAAAILGVAASLVIGTGVALYSMVQAREAERRAVTTAYLADMQAAHQALKGNNFAAFSRILDQNQSFPPDQDPRNWEEK